MTWKNRLDRICQKQREQNLWRSPVTVGSAQSRTLKVDGRELLNFCSNDYLGLANDPELIEAVQDAAEKWGVGSGASHLVCGHTEIHERLAQELAAFVGAERALLFSSGYLANLAIPQAFLGRHGLLVQDKLNHASLLDAAVLSRANTKRYVHGDRAAAERLLAESNAESKMLMTDSVFSMDGDVAPAAALDEICKRHDALLVVDEAHGFGVLGPSGGGLLQQEQIPVADNVLLMGTLGKSVGSSGAFVAGDADVIDGLIQFARSYTYTTALPSAICAASLAALKIMRSGDGRRDVLFANVNRFRELAELQGLKLADSRTSIQPLIVGDAKTALRLSQRLLEQDIWVAAIRPPTVAIGSARLRITITAAHTTEDIEHLVMALAANLVTVHG